ncbi:hypothetical protein [Hugenholtzia roseola]|uniref:hypothetical protein n=1 Tax=Hugenholtzia roseola TaxID=1002 RepID=UPI000400D846|nr:hypothetical protein [Hugenholtzia roseola]
MKAYTKHYKRHLLPLGERKSTFPFLAYLPALRRLPFGVFFCFWLLLSGFTAFVPLEEDVPHIELSQVQDYIGKEVWIENLFVAQIRDTEKAVFLNINRSYPNQEFALVVFSDFWEAFEGSDLKRLEGKRIRVFGKVLIYKQNNLQVHLKNPTQIEALE